MDDIIICNYCMKSFDRFSNSKHYWLDNDNENISHTIYECPYCNMRFELAEGEVNEI